MGSVIKGGGKQPSMFKLQLHRGLSRVRMSCMGMMVWFGNRSQTPNSPIWASCLLGRKVFGGPESTKVLPPRVTWMPWKKPIGSPRAASQSAVFSA